MKKLNLLILLLGILHSSQTLLATEVFRSFSQHRFDSYYDVSYFKTESNFIADGSQQSLPAGNSFQVIDVNLQLRYVFFEDFGMYTGMTVGNSESNDFYASRKNSSISSAHLGVDYLFFQNHLMSYYLDLSYHQAIQKVATDTDSALNSDGVGEAHAQIFSIFDLDFIQPYGALGVNYRLEGLSTLLTYSLGLQTSISDFVLGFALNGYASVADDKYTNTPNERDFVNYRVDASSKKYNAINPNNLDGDIYMKYIFDEDFLVSLNGGYSIVGSNSALGYHVGAGVAWGFGANHKKPSVPKANPSHHIQSPAPREKVQQPVKKFQEDTNDGVNQDYFKPVAPAKELEENSTSVTEDEEEIKVVPKKVNTPKTLKDNEYKIKLKKKKKKKPNR